MLYAIKDFFNYPTIGEVRAASYELAANNAIHAWDQGLYGLALAWVGFDDVDEVEVCLVTKTVLLRGQADPTGGNSPRSVQWCSKLIGDTAKSKLSSYILAVSKILHEVNAGIYDSTQGLRPTAVFVDRDGDIAVSYPAGPDWESWELKVDRP